MSRDKKLNRTQEVIGSIPFSSTKIHDLCLDNLAATPSTAVEAACVASVAAENLTRISSLL
jgi:hypothetical protein